jgi:hypothetical protein
LKLRNGADMRKEVKILEHLGWHDRIASLLATCVDAQLNQCMMGFRV